MVSPRRLAGGLVALALGLAVFYVLGTALGPRIEAHVGPLAISRGPAAWALAIAGWTGRYWWLALVGLVAVWTSAAEVAVRWRRGGQRVLRGAALAVVAIDALFLAYLLLQFYSVPDRLAP